MTDRASSYSAISIKEKPLDGISAWLLYLQIIGAIFLQKIAIPMGGSAPIFLELFILFAVTAFGVLAGRLELRRMRLALYLLMASGMTLIQLIRNVEFSLSSLLLLLMIHLPYIFGLKYRSAKPGAELLFFQKIMVFVAVLGVIQFASQFVIGWHYAFLLDTQLPKQFIMSGYNNLNTVRLGSGIYKSNGVFMLEPSMFCQFLALSIIIEMAYFKRAKFMLCYIAGIFSTFSGTGLVILALLVPMYLILHRRFTLLIFIGCALGAIILSAPFIGLGDYVGRVNEFSSTRSSGFARFISVFPIVRDFILPQPDTLLLGLGAGANKTIGEHVSYEVHLPSWGKIWLEYGLIGFAFYLPLMLNVLLTPKRSGYLKAALAIQFFFDGYVLIPTVHGILLALMAWPSEEAPEDDKNTLAEPSEKNLPLDNLPV